MKKNKRKYKEYTDDDVIQAVSSSKSLAQVLKKLDLVVAGGNYDHIKLTIQQLNLDCSHFTGKAWNKGERMKDWSDYSRGSKLKPHLIKKRNHKCENCGNTEWMGLPISLEIEHIDGDKTNNCETNLKLLCCNCHAQTPTWRRQKN
jgi:hypothetical protein